RGPHSNSPAPCRWRCLRSLSPDLIRGWLLQPRQLGLCRPIAAAEIHVIGAVELAVLQHLLEQALGFVLPGPQQLVLGEVEGSIAALLQAPGLGLARRGRLLDLRLARLAEIEGQDRARPVLDRNRARIGLELGLVVGAGARPGEMEPEGPMG